MDNKKDKILVEYWYKKYQSEKSKNANLLEDICNWIEDNFWNYLGTRSRGELEILEKIELNKMLTDLKSEMEKSKASAA